MAPIASAPRNKIILLGASNLTLSLPHIVALSQRIFGGPNTIYVAAGHGRSYGRQSRVLFRGLPGIVESGLWQFLANDYQLPTYALITDIGNDIAYGYVPDKITGWIRICIDRLQHCHARIVMTSLPMQNLAQLSDLRFHLLKTFLFPFCSLSRQQAIDQSQILNQMLHQLAIDEKLIWCQPDPRWFGFDAIHIRRQWRIQAYTSILRKLSTGNCTENLESDTDISKEWHWYKQPQPEIKDILGIKIRRPQPSLKFFDGSTVSMY